MAGAGFVLLLILDGSRGGAHAREELAATLPDAIVASDSDPQVVTKAVRAPARRESRCGPRVIF